MNYEVGKRYSFEIYPSAMVPTDFKKVSISIAAMDANMARNLSDIDSAHKAYLPVLPPNTPVSADAHQYIYVQLATGEKVVLAKSWIKEETVKVVTGVRITAVVEDDSIESVAIIQRMFATNGYQPKITVE